jgi:hypothetical protein
MQHHHHHEQAPEFHESGPAFAFRCGPDERLSLLEGMCEPLPKAEERVQRVMLHGNAFFTGIRQDGPRGRDGFAIPNWLMAQAGSDFGTKQFFDISAMLTFERWTFPRAAYPELLQTGEANADGEPFVDAQHPHSSPVMGITFSDSFRLTETSHMTLAFSPRGSAADGPIAFMHRPTSVNNPDAPLGHHLGQDAGHISSTVLSASLETPVWILEVSGFNGREPEPEKVDLPLGPVDSAAARIGWKLNGDTLLLASYAYVNGPEHDGPKYYRRQSFSIYNELPSLGGWRWQNALIFGRIQNYDFYPNLSSWAEEMSLANGPSSFWARFESVERSAAQLQLAGADPARRWISLITAGYTFRMLSYGGMDLSAGAAATKYMLPAAFHEGYGNDPWALKAILQVSGMKMWP